MILHRVLGVALLFTACARQRPTTEARALDPDPAEQPLAAPVSVEDAGPTPCVPEGVEGSPAGAGLALPCCGGLGRVLVYKWSLPRLDDCVVAGGGRYLCVKCGDGRCGIGENRCNCPADCH